MDEFLSTRYSLKCWPVLTNRIHLLLTLEIHQTTGRFLVNSERIKKNITELKDELR